MEGEELISAVPETMAAVAGGAVNVTAKMVDAWREHPFLGTLAIGAACGTVCYIVHEAAKTGGSIEATRDGVKAQFSQGSESVESKDAQAKIDDAVDMPYTEA